MPEHQSLTTTIYASGIDSAPSRARWSDVHQFSRRYLRVILLVMVLTVTGAYATLSLLTEQYDAEATLLVKIGRETLDPPAVSRNVPLTAGLRHEEVVSEIEILKSPGLIADTVDAIGVDAFKSHPTPPATFIGRLKGEVKTVVRFAKQQYQETLIALDLKKRLDDRQKAIEGVTNSLAVDNVKDSDVILVTLRMPDPELAVQIENKLIALYLDRRLSIRSTPGVQEFLSEAAKRDQQALEEAEAQKQSWKRQTGIVSAQDQKALLLKQIRDIEGSAATSQGEIDGLEKEIAASRQLLATTPEYLRSSQQETPNPSMQSVEEKVITLKLQRAQALSKYRPESGVVVALDQEIEHLTELLKTQKETQVGSVTSQLNPNRLALEQQLEQATIRIDGLRATKARQDIEVANLNAQLQTIDQADVHLTDIERKRQIAEQDYMNVAKRSFDSDISNQLDRDRISNVSVSSPPTAGFEPVYPRKLLIMAVSLVAGLILGISLALMLNYFDDQTITPEQVELESGIPCLGVIEDGGIPSATA